MSRNIRSIRFYVIVGLIGLVVFLCTNWILAAAVIFLLWFASHIFDEDEDAGAARQGGLALRNHKDKYVAESVKKRLDAVLKDSQGILTFRELLSIWGVTGTLPKPFPRKMFSRLVYALRKLGYGIVPNYLSGQKRLDHDDPCVLFRIPANASDLNLQLVHQHEIFCKLYSIVLNGERLSSEDREYVKKCIRQSGAPVGYHGYLYAYLVWLSLKKQIYDKRTKDEVSLLSQNVKNNMIPMLVNSVYINGAIDNQRMGVLKRILPTLGYDPGAIHSLLHQTLTDESGFATVERSEGSVEYTIRRPEPKKEGVHLDQDRLDELREQTRAAQSLLSDIFVQEVDDEPEAACVQEDDGMLHVLEKMFEKEIWTRTEIQELAGPGVMIGSLLEKINDYSCSKVDDIVVEEDGENIYVTVEYKGMLI